MAEDTLTSDQADGEDESPNGNDTFDSAGKQTQATDAQASEEAPAGDQTPAEVPAAPKEGEETPAPKEGEEAKLTEKGTKLDPNPQSAVHQELANAKKALADVGKILNDPQALNEYAKQKFGDGAKAEEPKPPVVYKAEDLENLDDVATVLNKIQSEHLETVTGLQTTVKQLSTAVNSLLVAGKQSQVASKMEQDVRSLQSVPELDPKSSDFIEGLEGDIAEMYHKLDFDESTGGYKGEHSIAEIAKAMVEAAKKAKAKGSEKAQTVVKDKSEGKITTSPKVTEAPSSDNQDPATSIAQGISRLKF